MPHCSYWKSRCGIKKVSRVYIDSALPWGGAGKGPSTLFSAFCPFFFCFVFKDLHSESSVSLPESWFQSRHWNNSLTEDRKPFGWILNSTRDVSHFWSLLWNMHRGPVLISLFSFLHIWSTCSNSCLFWCFLSLFLTILHHCSAMPCAEAPPEWVPQAT